jgi:hypothetical protein
LLLFTASPPVLVGADGARNIAQLFFLGAKRNKFCIKRIDPFPADQLGVAQL